MYRKKKFTLQLGYQKPNDAYRFPNLIRSAFFVICLQTLDLMCLTIY